MTAEPRQRLRLTAGVVAASFLAGLLAAGCATRIQRVLDDPSRYRDREVTVSGTVVDSYSVAGRGAYQLQDRSGRLWVITDRGVPRRGAEVRAKGTVREIFNLGSLGELLRLPGGGVVLVESAR
jgi:hypothetical protein